MLAIDMKVTIILRYPNTCPLLLYIQTQSQFVFETMVHILSACPSRNASVIITLFLSLQCFIDMAFLGDL